MFLLTRFKAHGRSKESAEWWPLQARHTITYYDTEPEALAAETAAIIAERPAFNRRNVPRAHKDQAAALRQLCLAGAAS